MFHILLGCIATAFLSAILTPIVRKVAFKIGAVDKPDKRRMNKKIMPSMGGLSIFLTFFISVFFIQPFESPVIMPLFLGSLIIVLTGIVDDIKEISPKMKILGIILASLIVYYYGGIGMNSFTIPGIGMIYLGAFSLPITLLWIMGITNALNLIDGLDGLASGVSMIGLTTMGIIGFFFLTTDDLIIPLLIFTFVAAIFGFFPYNFYPAKIYLGDTGSLFLGFLIAVFSLHSLKNVTLISLIIPIVILGIPITDTFYAIIRRVLDKKPISQPDKEHLHHRIMILGFTHRQTVLFIYSIALIFSIIALLYPISTFWGSVLITIFLLISLELFVELIGLVGKDKRPLIGMIRRFTDKLNKKK